MASAADRGRTLRIHESFRDAPPEVLRCLGEIFSSRSPRKRADARLVVREFVATRRNPAPRRPRGSARVHAADLPHLARLQAEFDDVNARYFSGSLPSVPIRLSGRMKRRNGHFSAEPLEIAISRLLCSRGLPGESERTMRHEMIHLWQWTEGVKPGHGKDFRRWARRLGIHPRATRAVCWIEESG